MRKIIFLLLLLPSLALAAPKTAYFKDDCANNGDGTGPGCAASPGAAGAYNSCANAVAAEKGDLVTATRLLTLVHVGSATASSTACNFLATDWTVNSSYYPQLVTLTSDRHSGTANTGEARFSVSDNTAVIRIEIPYMDLEGEQINQTKTGAGSSIDAAGIKIYLPGTVTAGRIRIKQNIVWYTGDYTNQGAQGIAYAVDSTGVEILIENNIVYDWNYDIFGRCRVSDTCTIHNNTLTDAVLNEFWFERYNGTVNFYNNLIQGAGTNIQWNGSSGATFNSATNITEDTSSPNGASFQSKVAVFVNEASNNFLLDSTDTVAKDLGTDRSAAGVTVDIQNNARPYNSVFDIGASEYTLAPTPTPTPGAVTARKGQKCSAATKGQCLL